MEGSKKRQHLNKLNHDGNTNKKLKGENKYNNNTKMHPNNLYKDSPPDFSLLARKYASFSPFVHTNTAGVPSIDWTDPFAVKELTKVLLDNDFQIKFDMPMDRLCPTVTLRSNYIHWLNDLMSLSEHEAPIRGIDIGTGASCIYPLLGRRLYEWSFLATDIDEYSLEHAKANVERNGWENEIELRFVPDRKNILAEVLKDEERFDFCMCNPPFFENMEQTGLSDKTVCTGSSNELVTEGGEYQFVGKMIADSLVLKDKVRWYTSMIGRKASMKQLLAELRQNQIVNVRTTTFYQGRTTRWAIAWSFGKDGFEELLEQRRQETINKRRAPSSCCFDVITQQPASVLRMLSSLLVKLDIEFSANPQLFNVKGQITESAWLHAMVSQELEDNKPFEEGGGNDFIGPAPPPPNKTLTTTTTETGTSHAGSDSSNETEFIGPAIRPSKLIQSSEPSQSSQLSQQSQPSHPQPSQPPETISATEATLNVDLASPQKGCPQDDEILCKFEIMLLKVRGNEYMVDFKLRGGESQDVFVDFFELCKKHVKQEMANVP